MSSQYFLSDDLIGLRRITGEDDLTAYVSWFNDQAINEYNSHAVYPMTKENILSYINSLGRDILFLSIFDLEKGKHLGNLSLQNIDFINRNAELAIIMGDKAVWGKGYSYRACKLLIGHGFNRMNLHRIYCGTSELNIGMQKLALKLGMQLEGVRKQAIFTNGLYHDIFEYGIVKQ